MLAGDELTQLAQGRFAEADAIAAILSHAPEIAKPVVFENRAEALGGLLRRALREVHKPAAQVIANYRRIWYQASHTLSLVRPPFHLYW